MLGALPAEPQQLRCQWYAFYHCLPGRHNYKGEPRMYACKAPYCAGCWSANSKPLKQVSEVEKNVWPVIVAGKVKPMVYKSFPLSEAAEAHRLMESSKHTGKILLIP
ncbi:hypothetical protein AAC387_Pa06g3211 [Persea americana]